MTRTIDELAVLTAAAKRISELIRSSDLETPVEHLGRWKVRDVVAHLGGVHRWATRIVVSRSQAGPGFRKSKLTDTELCDWFDEGATELVERFGENDPDDACPNFNPGSPNTVGWWFRRQMHETNVHRWDIERALDCTTPVDPMVAADGIDEFLDVFVRTRGKQTLSAPLSISSTRPNRTWTLTPAKKPGRIDIDVEGVDKFAAEVSGSPEHLLLALWRSVEVADADVSIQGDVDVAASVFRPR